MNNNLSREQQNQFLRQHGYHWEQITQHWLDDNDDFDTEPGWHLYAPDGREVNVSRAFAEIERGVAVVAAEYHVAAAVEAAEHDRRAEMKRWHDRLAQIIQQQGARPEGDNSPEGERVLDTQDIYGGGDWFVIGAENIWYVRNNGMDGDCWANNNVRTGGAGAIGYCIPADTDIEDALRSLAAGAVPTMKMF